MTATVVPLVPRTLARHPPAPMAPPPRDTLPVGARVRHLTRDQVGTVVGHGSDTLHWVKFPRGEEWCCPRVSLALLALPDLDLHDDDDEPRGAT